MNLLDSLIKCKSLGFWYVESVDDAGKIMSKILKRFKKIRKKIYEKTAEITTCEQKIDTDHWATYNLGRVGRF